MNKYPIMSISPLRMASDGKGITTLIGLNGCPLDCKYCINKTILKRNQFIEYSPMELYERVKNHNLYYLATGGGITFGGGEPLQYPQLIKDFKSICPNEWNINVETSLNVPLGNVQTTIGSVNHYYVDIKDINNKIYSEYTGKDNSQMVENLKYLIENVNVDSITIRVPNIEKFNTKQDVSNSIDFLKSLGLKNFDIFDYITID